MIHTQSRPTVSTAPAAPVTVRPPAAPAAPVAPVAAVAPKAPVAPAPQVVPAAPAVEEADDDTSVKPVVVAAALSAGVTSDVADAAESGVDAAEDGDDETPAAPSKAKAAKPSRKNRWIDGLLLALAVLLLGSAAFLGYQALHKTTSTVTFPDMAGNRVVPDDPSAQDPVFQQKANAIADVGVRFKIDSVGLDVPLGEVNEVNGVMNPPGFTSAYRVRNRGVTLDQAASGTVYVVTHALRPPGKAPGNFVTNLTTGTIVVNNGDLIQVGDLTYRVVSSEIIAKTQLGAEADLWANTPGMLVFITCLETKIDSTGHAVNNAVIIGQLVTQ